MWTRLYGKEVQNPYERYTMCQRLRQTLCILGVEQMIIGHTPQVGLLHVCHSEYRLTVLHLDI